MNYYQILNIDNNATTKEIKKHYYKLAKLYHPDKNNFDKFKCEKFKLLSEAYSILSNPKKRYLYDLKLKYNLNEFFNLNFTDDDYEKIHTYYNKMMNLTEIKFLYLIFSSLPEEIKNKIKNKVITILDHLNLNQNSKNDTLITIDNIKYIDICELKENYSINLFRSFNDIYNNILKQIIILGKYNTYHIFITSFNYCIHLQNGQYYLKINILGNLQNFEYNKYNLIYTQTINLYQYYYGDYYSIFLNDKKIVFKNNTDRTLKMNSLGFKNPFNGNRGELYIYFKLNLKQHILFNKNENKELMYQLFNI